MKNAGGIGTCRNPRQAVAVVAGSWWVGRSVGTSPLKDEKLVPAIYIPARSLLRGRSYRYLAGLRGALALEIFEYAGAMPDDGTRKCIKSRSTS